MKGQYLPQEKGKWRMCCKKRRLWEDLGRAKTGPADQGHCVEGWGKGFPGIAGPGAEREKALKRRNSFGKSVQRSRKSFQKTMGSGIHQ